MTRRGICTVELYYKLGKYLKPVIDVCGKMEYELGEAKKP